MRPSTATVAAIKEEWQELGFMTLGSIPADWRHRRSAVQVRLPDLPFLDVEDVHTHQALRQALALGLSALGQTDLNVANVRGEDRRVTRLISDWAWQRASEGEPVYAGVRYLSKINTEWECWAVFDDVTLEVIETRPITLDMTEMLEVADLYGLQVF